MDSSGYSDDPLGPSPWASSPKANRTASNRDSTGSSNPPASPTPAPLAGRASLDSSQQTLDASTLTASSVGDAALDGEHSQTLPDEAPGAAAAAPPQRYHRPSGQYPPQQQQQQQQQQPQQPRQQYKLQPKVTGLERPTRKDLIIRFDIYVRNLPTPPPKPAPPPRPRDPTVPPTSFDDLVPASAHDPTLTLPQTNLTTFRTTQFRDVRRTHAEFQKLADHLISANPEALVPAVPPPSTPAGIGTDEDEARTKAALQRWLTIVCSNDILMRDDEIVRFIEGDPGYSPVFRRSQPATGVRRKMLKQFAPPPDDTPELADARPTVKRFYLCTMDTSQKLDRAVKARRSLGLALTTFGAALAAVGDLEPYAALKTGQRKLGRTIQQTGDLYAVQATMEATTLADPLAYLSSDAFIVKETLTNRQILQRDLLQAQATTRAKLSATDRLRASTSVRRDKVDEAIAALDEAREAEEYLGHKTARITACLLHEQRRWAARSATDLRAAVREFTLRHIDAERRLLATLETVRPDVRAIDPAGGLSRLGREGPRSRVQASSQGPKGDAWSGVPRAAEGGRSGLAVYPVREGDEGERPRSVKEDEDEDKVDARNAASRLAASTF